jgi:hypothetical protein
MGGVGGHQVRIDAVSALLTAAAKTLDYETWDAQTLASSEIASRLSFGVAQVRGELLAGFLDVAG